jgi:hypothetical protein
MDLRVMQQTLNELKKESQEIQDYLKKLRRERGFSRQQLAELELERQRFVRTNLVFQ